MIKINLCKWLVIVLRFVYERLCIISNGTCGKGLVAVEVLLLARSGHKVERPKNEVDE